jgi:hypothetical protein
MRCKRSLCDVCVFCQSTELQLLILSFHSEGLFFARSASFIAMFRLSYALPCFVPPVQLTWNNR